MKIEEILSLPDIGERIKKIKEARKTPLPDRDQLMAEWDPHLHDVMDKEKRPDEIKVVDPEKRDPVSGNILRSAVIKVEPVNRIPFPLEQDITNIHTSFTVGIEPSLTCETEDEREKELFKIIKLIDRKNKIKYHNKRVVRSWLSEQDVAEYWYTVEDKNFWRLILNKIKASMGKNIYPERKMRCAIWSPFRGDKLYPFFDEVGDYKGLGREYQVKVNDTQMDTYFMFVSDKMVYIWHQVDGRWEETAFAHQFKKNPTIYGYRAETLCKKIKPMRERIEVLMSNYADCIDYNFAPKLVAKGRVIGNHPKAARGGMVELEEGSELAYLSWQQTPEAAKLELETLTEQSYSLTNTPRISFENMQGMGNAFSGAPFQFAFMGAHMAVAMHEESIGEYLQRRYNFLVSAVGSVNTAYSDVADTIDLDVEIVPYMINNRLDSIKEAIDAVGGNIASRKTGVILAGLVDEDKIDEELAAIEKEAAKEVPQHPIGYGSANPNRA